MWMNNDPMNPTVNSQDVIKWDFDYFTKWVLISWLKWPIGTQGNMFEAFIPTETHGNYLRTLKPNTILKNYYDRLLMKQIKWGYETENMSLY